MKRSSLVDIWSLLTPQQHKSAVILLGLMIVGSVLETLGVGLVIPVIALITDENLSKSYPQLRPALDFLGNPGQKTLIVGAMVALLAIYVVKSLFLGFLAWRQYQFAFGTQAELSQRLFKTYLRQPYTFHLQRNSAQLIHNSTTETQLLTFNTILPLITTLGECCVVLGLAALLLVAEPLGAVLIAIILTSAAFVFHRITRARLSRWGEARHIHEEKRLQHLQQGLGGAKDVKLLGREQDFLQQYRLHSNESARVLRNQLTLQQFPRLWLELLAITGLAGLVILMIARDRSIATIGPTLGLFAVAAFRLMPSVNRILGAIQSLRFGKVTIRTIYDELALGLSEPPLILPSALSTRPWRSIELRGLTYQYPGAHVPSLRDVSFAIQRGETIGLIGSSGSGKSTLVDVVLGLLTPCAGQVRVGEEDIQANLRAWQNQIGYVPQSIYLTDDTLRRNVAFGLPSQEIDEAAVVRAIKSAQLEDFVASLPTGLDSMVGERGVRISGGQRQRIGIARALYHDPAVLVLDEATSALDTPTEKGVMEAITALHGTKTILIVAHRMSTVEHCDRLYRLEGGILAASSLNAEVSRNR